MADATLGLIFGQGLIVRRLVSSSLKLDRGGLVRKHSLTVPPSPAVRNVMSTTVADHRSPGAFAPKSKLLAACLDVPPNA